MKNIYFQGNLLRLLPPSFGMLKDNLVGPKKVLKIERNAFIPHLEAKRKQGMTFFFHYLNSEGKENYTKQLAFLSNNSKFELKVDLKYDLKFEQNLIYNLTYNLT